MPKGVYPRKRKIQRTPQAFVQARPMHRQETNSRVLSVEPTVPTVHIERGSGGEYRYGVRSYGLTAAGAREDALREFIALEQAVNDLKNTVRGLTK